MLRIIQIQLALKTLKNSLIIFNGSFFVGVIWIIICYVDDKIVHLNVAKDHNDHEISSIT